MVCGFFQTVRIILYFVSESKLNNLPAEVMRLTPWYFWVIGWLLLLWVGTLKNSLKEKEIIDKTSFNFFEGFLAFLIKEGHALFNHSEDKDFYSKIEGWQRMVIEGIALGRGPEASEAFFHKMESQYPLSNSYRDSLRLNSSEPLNVALQGNLEELETIRKNLKAGMVYEKGELEAVKRPEHPVNSFPQLPS